MCQKNPASTLLLLVISTRREKRRQIIRPAAVHLRLLVICGHLLPNVREFAKSMEALLRHQALGSLARDRRTKPFGKGALDIPGVELDVNASRVNPFIERQSQHRAASQPLCDLIHARFRQRNVAEQHQLGLM